MSLKGNIRAMMMGMPSGRSSGPPSPSQAQVAGEPDAAAHFHKAAASHKAGDHATARKHAFKGIRALGSASNGGTGDLSANTVVKTAGPNAAFPGGGAPAV